MDPSKNMAYTAVLLASKTDLKREPENAYPAIMLSIYCRSRLNGGIIEDIDRVFADRILREDIGLSSRVAKRVLTTPSQLWEIVLNENTNKRDLHVKFYSTFHEKRFIGQSAARRLGGLRSAATRAKLAQNKKITHTSNSGKKSTALPTALASKERKNIHSINISKGGGATMPRPPAFDDDPPRDAEPLSREEALAFFAKLTRELDDEIASPN